MKVISTHANCPAADQELPAVAGSRHLCAAARQAPARRPQGEETKAKPASTPVPGIEPARRLHPQQRLAAVGAKCRTWQPVMYLLQGLLEIAEDTGMGEALRAAGLDVDKLKREAQEKLVSRSPVGFPSAREAGC